MDKEEINYDYYGSYSFPKWISRLVIPVAIMVILSLVLIDAIHKRTANNRTRGMQPEEVVQSFFSGINQNDLALVWDCIDHKKTNPLSHPLLSYSLNTQRRHLEDAYHGHTQLEEGEISFTPIEWEEKGKP